MENESVVEITLSLVRRPFSQFAKDLTENITRRSDRRNVLVHFRVMSYDNIMFSTRFRPAAENDDVSRMRFFPPRVRQPRLADDFFYDTN